MCKHMGKAFSLPFIFGLTKNIVIDPFPNFAATVSLILILIVQCHLTGSKAIVGSDQQLQCIWVTSLSIYLYKSADHMSNCVQILIHQIFYFSAVWYIHYIYLLFFLFESYIASFNMFWVKITMLDKDVFDFQIELYIVQMDLIICLKNQNSLNEVDSNFETPQTSYYSRTLHFPWQQNYKLSIRFDSFKFFISMNFWKNMEWTLKIKFILPYFELVVKFWVQFYPIGRTDNFESNMTHVIADLANPMISNFFRNNMFELHFTFAVNCRV